MDSDLNRDYDYLRACSNREACQYLGTKVRQWRLAEGISQLELASRSGVPLRTFKRFESHGKANLETFIQVLSALGRLPYLFMLFPVATKYRPSVNERLRQMAPTKFKP